MILENRTWDEIAPGDSATVERPCTEDDFYVFATASGNHNPLHLPGHDGDGDGAPEAWAPAAWVASLVSAALGNRLPGPGTVYRAMSFRFHGQAGAGDLLSVTVRVTEKREGGVVVLAAEVARRDGTRILTGEVEVTAPSRKLRFDDASVPGLILERHRHFDALLARAEPLPAIPTAVVAPEAPDALEGALLAMRHTLIAPILVGHAAKIREAAGGVSLDGIEIVDEPDHARAAARAVALVHEGRARALMKGHLHTDTLLAAVVKREGGLRTGRRLSHVFVMDVPGLDKLLFVTDAAINIAPDLEEKADIIQNAIDLALALGVEEPKVGVLSAVETVNPRIPSTLDAAVLSKMAERGQITGGVVDGPLAMDNAINMEAARTKGLKSLVAGRADILCVPNLEAGNMVAKELTFAAHAEAAGVVVGAMVPIVLTSRADDEKARLASCAVAALHAEWLKGRA